MSLCPILGGVGRQRMARSRSAMPRAPVAMAHDVENVAPNMQHNSLAPPIGTAPSECIPDKNRPLGNVTNMLNQLTNCNDVAKSSMRPCDGVKVVTVADRVLSVPPLPAAARQSNKSSVGATGGDAESVASSKDEDPQQVAEYIRDIFETLHREEGLLLPNKNYMDNQQHVTAKMRAILVDWLVDVHRRYKMRPETLFLGVSIADRYLEKQVTGRRFLQLVGVTSLFIASKFEDTFPPSVADLVNVTDKAYTADEVKKMEITVLNVLDFKVCRPTAIQFLDRLHTICRLHDVHRELSQYLLELTLGEYKMLKYTPAHLASAALLLSNKLLRRQPAWPAAAVQQMKLSEQALRECAKEIMSLFTNAEQNNLQAVRKKFSQQQHQSVAKLNFIFTSSQSSAEEYRGSHAVRRVPGPQEPLQQPLAVRRTSCPGHSGPSAGIVLDAGASGGTKARDLSCPVRAEKGGA